MAGTSVAVMTDSNSGISQEKAKEMGIRVIPMPFFINGEEYFEDINLTQRQFFDYMADKDTVFKTSMPSPGDVMDVWDDLLKSYDEIVYIPMSSGLSSSCQSAKSLAEDYDGKVQVVDNHRISAAMYQSVRDALFLRDRGKNAEEIRKILEEKGPDSTIYLMVDSLDHLKKGGRITPAAALIGKVLGIKPVLQIQGEKLDAYSRSRGVKMARKQMLQALQKDFDTRFPGLQEKGFLNIQSVITFGMEEQGLEWAKMLKEAFPEQNVPQETQYLSLSIACHTGPGVLAVAASEALDRSYEA